jgi:hypothetical protein
MDLTTDNLTKEFLVMAFQFTTNEKKIIYGSSQGNMTIIY